MKQFETRLPAGSHGEKEKKSENDAGCRLGRELLRVRHDDSYVSWLGGICTCTTVNKRPCAPSSEYKPL